MRGILSLIVAAAVLPAAPAIAGDKKPKDPNEIVCKSERFVGSNRSTRICRSRADWENSRTDSQQALDSKMMRVVQKKTGG